MWKEVEKIVADDINNFTKELIDKAAQEDMDAIYKIARLYEQGLEVPMNNAKAFKIFELCVNKGMVDAKIRVADKLFRGKGIVKNINMAKELLSEPIEAMKVRAFMLMANILVYENRKSEAISYYLKAEEIFKKDNQNISEYTMAIMYGKMVEVYMDKEINNPLKAIEYNDKALKENVFCNSKIIGDLFYYGYGVEKDLKKAEFYYDRIAREEICNGCNARCNEYCQTKLYSIWSSYGKK